MSDDRLFRWNLTIHLKCERCNHTVFVEEVSRGEIFCASCGNIVAKTHDEWPPNWEQSAAFGTSEEKSWSESIRLAQTSKDAKSPALLPGSAAVSPSVDTSKSLSETNPCSNSPQLHLTPPPCQIQDSIIVQSLQLSTSQNIQRDKIPNDPDHLYDSELTLLSKELNLPDEIVPAAKRIIVRVQTDTDFQSLYRKSKKNTFRLVTRAAILGACRQLGVPKTFKELEIDLTQGEKLSFHKVFKLIDSILKKYALTSGLSEKESNVFPSLFSVRDFVLSQAKTLGLSDEILNRGLLISENRDVQNLFSGKQPNAAAAVVLAFAAACEKYYLDVVDYARVANVSVGTFALSQKAFFKFLQDMYKRGKLPHIFHC